MIKKCLSDREKLLRFETEGREFARFLRSLKQFMQTAKIRTIFDNRMPFYLVPGRFSTLKIRNIKTKILNKLGKNIGV